MPGDLIAQQLRGLRNTRDLRAELLGLASAVAAGNADGCLEVIQPIISVATVREEWQRAMSALSPSVRKRLRLVVTAAEPSPAAGLLPLLRPNYRYEVLRLLVGANLEDDGPQPEAGVAAHIDRTQLGLIRAVGASQTPIRAALVALRDAGIVQSMRRLELEPEALTSEVLSRVGALPQVLKFRFERGAALRSPQELLLRVINCVFFEI